MPKRRIPKRVLTKPPRQSTWQSKRLSRRRLRSKLFKESTLLFLKNKIPSTMNTWK